MPSPSILVVDDDESIRESLIERFTARGYEVSSAASGEDAIAAARARPDVILLDLQLPRGDGIAVLGALEREGIDSTVIVITAYGTIGRAVEAMRAGAYDFLQKPFEPKLVEETIRRGLERSALRRENRALRAGRREPPFVVADGAMAAVVETAKRAAPSRATVLVLGESGTGKEVLARRVHAWSDRADGPFVAVNCAAIADTLLESELFGHEKGAFTGATARKQGKVELAHGGTLFLDEIGDVSAAFQVKLLRFLQERTFERVGGTRSLSVDVRLVAATNRDLSAAIEDGSFRDDLYYRLAVIAVSLPPLRERPDDVVALTEHFVVELAGDAKRVGLGVSDEALALLRGHRWPGNIRELKNALERAVVLCRGDVIEPEDLPPELLGGSGSGEGPSSTDGFHDQVEAFRRKVIADALAACEGNRTRAAERLGLQRTYLSRMIRQYGL